MTFSTTMAACTHHHDDEEQSRRTKKWPKDIINRKLAIKREKKRVIEIQRKHAYKTKKKIDPINTTAWQRFKKKKHDSTTHRPTDRPTNPQIKSIQTRSKTPSTSYLAAKQVHPALCCRVQAKRPTRAAATT